MGCKLVALYCYDEGSSDNGEADGWIMLELGLAVLKMELFLLVGGFGEVIVVFVWLICNIKLWHHLYPYNRASYPFIEPNPNKFSDPTHHQSRDDKPI